MTEKKVRCDHCGAPAGEIRYNYRREFDGQSSETEYDTIDLCRDMSMMWLQKFLQEPPKAPAECLKDQFARWAKEQRWKP